MLRNSARSARAIAPAARKRAITIASKSSSDMTGNNDLHKSATVSTGWLAERLQSVAVLDCSWYLPSAKREPKREFQDVGRIPCARFFDADAVKDISSQLPHMLPPPHAFACAMDALGVDNDTPVVLYDCASTGLFSAARVYWMLQVFGHPNCAVLNGGFKKWRSEGREIESGAVDPSWLDAAANACEAAQEEGAQPKPSYSATLDASLVRSKDEVMQRVAQKMSEQLVDARPADRFKGTGDEPNPQSKKGHVPNSVNVPAMSLLREDTGELKSEDELRKLFEDAGVDLQNNNKPIVLSCGSGMTACILKLGLSVLGRDNAAVYDGSWREWGTAADTPVISEG